MHVASAHLRRHVVYPDALLVERHVAVDRFDAVRQREIPEAAVRNRRVSREGGRREGTVHLRVQFGGPRAADVAEEALQDAEVGIARRVDRDLRVVQIHRAVQFERRPVAGEMEPDDVQHVLVQRQPDRPFVVRGIVEQLQVQLFDVGVDQDIDAFGFQDVLVEEREFADAGHRKLQRDLAPSGTTARDENAGLTQETHVKERRYARK